jgi:hypothetical protein
LTVQSTTSRADYTGNGSTTAFTVPFYFLDNTHVQVFSTVIATGVTTTLVLGTDYTLTGAGVSTGGTVTTTVAPTTSQKLSVLRNVPLSQLIHYVPNDPFPAATHEQALDQLTMEVQQVNETLARSIKLSATNTIGSTEFTVTAANRANYVLGFDSTGELSVTQAIGTYQGNWASGIAYKQRDLIKDTSNSNIYICNTAHTSSGTVPISSNTDVAKWGLIVDAATAATSASSAASSASSASTSATNAASSASSASTSASSASTSATNAASSASSASSSASSASTSATNALNNYNLFHNTYYGSYASDPTTRPDSTSRVTGDLYFNSTIAGMKAWSGSAWVTAYNTGGGSALISTNNLSDLTNVTTARTNLGLGGLATVTPGTGVATAAAAAIDATGGFISYATFKPAVGKSLTVSNSITIAGTDSTVMTFPAASDTVAGIGTVQTFTKAQRGTVSALTDGATITPDFSVANNFSVTLGGNRTLANPTNLTAGQSGAIVITQDGTGSRTLAYGSYWKFPSGTAPTLTTTASAVDTLVYYVESSTRISARLVNDLR